MKILQLCKKFPFPLKDGEAIAINALSQSLHQLGCEVTLLCMNTSKHYFDIAQLPKEFNHYKAIHHVAVNTDIHWFAALKNLFQDSSYNIDRFCSKGFRDRLVALLQKEQFDIIQLETLYLSPYVADIRAHSKAKIVMRAHNVEHEIWQRITGNTSFFLKKWYLKHLTKKLRQYEIAQLNAYDMLLAITQRDLKRFQRLGFRNEGMVVPIGLRIDDYPEDFRSFERPLSLSFIGSLDWMPNQEGLNWFLEEIWPKLTQLYPELSLHIAGRNTPKQMYRLNDSRIKVYGEVEDASVFIREHSIMIVPLLSGSGMRAKILEGMALNRVVLTTHLGLEGIEAEAGKEVLVADMVHAFVKRIEYIRQHPEVAVQIGRNARNFVETSYDSLQIGRRLAEQYQLLLEGKKLSTIPAEEEG
ncbi:MAG: glycosyltransferase family 4 protein [Bacteroidota bacterium]